MSGKKSRIQLGRGIPRKATITGTARIIAADAKAQLDAMEQVLDQSAQSTLPQASQRLKAEEKQEPNKGGRMSQALAYNTLPKTLNKQLSIFEALNHEQTMRRVIVENNLDKIGAELSVSEQRALGATLELLHNTGAYRLADEQLKRGETVTAEELVIPLQDYLKAYGAERVITSRNKLDYPRSEVQEALQGLKGLTKPVMQVWGLKNGAGRYRYAERTFGGLISQVSEQYYDVSDNTYKELVSGDTSVAVGAKFIRIVPSKIFYTRPFIRYPRHLVTELRHSLKANGERLTSTVMNIVNMLNLEAHNNDNDTVVRDYHTMIAQSGQNKAVEGKGSPRRYKRAEERINKALDQTKAIGAVQDHRIENDPLKGKQYRIKIDRNKIKGEDGSTQ
jgi:hypothetical protein